jgi:hypothetical protein
VLSFSLTRPQTVTTTFVSWTFPADGATAVSLTSAAGTLIGSPAPLNGDGPWSLPPRALAAGTYRLIVNTGASGDSGSVRVQLTSVASVKVGGASVQARIGGTEQPRLLAFTATAGQTVSVAATSQTFSQSSGATLDIENASGTPQGPPQFVGTSSGPAYAEATVATSGTYYVALRPASATATGKATLRLSSPAPPVRATVGGPAVTVIIARPGVPGTARFTGTAGETVAVLIKATRFTGDSTRLYLTSAAGTSVGPDQYLNGVSSTDGPVTLPATGTYTIVVDPNPGPAGTGHTGTVTLSLIRFTEVHKTATINGPAVTATITRPTQQAAEELIPIDQVARRFGLRASALRYYEERGLLSPASHHSGRRWYGPDEIRRVAAIRYWQEWGLMSLDEIAELTAGPTESRRWRARSSTTASRPSVPIS